MPPKTTPKKNYVNSLLTGTGSVTSYGSTTPKFTGGGTAGGGGGSWGPKKPANTTGMLGMQSTGTPTSGSSKLTQTNNPLQGPSQAWKDYGSGKSLSPDGKVIVTKPNATITASNPSATGSNPTAITSPAGQAYINNMTGGYNSVSTVGTGSSSAETEWKNSPEYKAYLKYKRDQENPSEATNALKVYQDSLKVLADVQTERENRETEARRQYEKDLDAKGGLKAGAEQAAALGRRRSNQELADIALRESAAARTAGVYQTGMEAGKKDGFSLGKDQVRYEYNPETGSYEAVGMGGGSSDTTMTGSYQMGQNSTIDSYIKAIHDGTAKISDVPDEYKDMVMQGLSSGNKPQSEISKQAITVIGELLSNPKLDRIFGPADQFVGGIFGDAALAKNKYDQLKGLLSLDNIKYLKGTGAISDAEQRLLANAASALGRNLGNEQARQVLTQLKADLEALQTQGQGGQQQGGEVIQTSAGPVYTNW